MKSYITKEEYWPVYEIWADPQPSYFSETNEAIAIDEKLLSRYRLSMIEFNAVQLQLEALYNKAVETKENV